MNDKNFETFLKNNTKAPAPPHDEWSRILAKIEEKKGLKSTFKNFKAKQLMLGFTGLAICIVVGLNTMTPGYILNNKNANLKEIDNFLIADSYFNETDTQYSWIEDF